MSKMGRALRDKARVMSRPLTAEEKHTRTPWTSGSGNDIMAADGTWLIRCNVELKDSVIPRILKAVNAHEQLVETLKLLTVSHLSNKERIITAKVGLRFAGEDV